MSEPVTVTFHLNVSVILDRKETSQNFPGLLPSSGPPHNIDTTVCTSRLAIDWIWYLFVVEILQPTSMTVRHINSFPTGSQGSRPVKILGVFLPTF